VLTEFARSITIAMEHVWARAGARCVSPFAQGDHHDVEPRAPLLDQPTPAVRRHLTARERDILRLLLADHTCRQIASALALSERTVEHYIDRLKLRLGKATLHGLVTLVFAERLLE